MLLAQSQTQIWGDSWKIEFEGFYIIPKFLSCIYIQNSFKKRVKHEQRVIRHITNSHNNLLGWVQSQTPYYNCILYT